MQELNQAYWNERYEQGNTGWNIGTVSSPLKDYFDQLPQKKLRILIPGGGNGHEAEYLLSLGFTNITILDIAPIALNKLEERFQSHIGQSLHLILGDFFDHQGQYDLIIEQTFFCALDPKLRQAYVEKMAALLSNNGRLSGSYLIRNFQEGHHLAEISKNIKNFFLCILILKHLLPVIIAFPKEWVMNVLSLQQKSKQIFKLLAFSLFISSLLTLHSSLFTLHFEL